ncbi:MAG: hypothetical protein IJ698_08935 [Prevotella sp.]|nr:hypothetical protein [Prevotella sp.]
MTSKISYIKTVDYCGNFIYVNGKLKRMLFPGGYVTILTMFLKGTTGTGEDVNNTGDEFVTP